MWWEKNLENQKFILMVIHHTNNSHNGGIFFHKWPSCFHEKLKVNSVQEACAKCFAVHILKIEMLQIT